MEIFWINNTELMIDNKEKLTPKEAIKKYPEYAEKINNLVKLRAKYEGRKNEMSSSQEKLKSSNFESNFDKKHGIITPNQRILEKSKPEVPFDKKIDSIKSKIDDILKEIKFDKNNKGDLERVAMELFKYVVYNSKYDISIMDEKLLETDMRKAEIDEIYNCLCENRSVCTSDASSLALLLRSVGIKSTHLTIAEKGENPKKVHEVVIFKNSDGEAMICDPTTIRTCIEEGQIPGINENVFAFPFDFFFENIYEGFEVKYVHDEIKLPDTPVKQ